MVEPVRLDRDAKHTQSLFRHLGIGFLDCGDVLFGDVAHGVAVHYAGAKRQQHIGRALDVRFPLAAVLVDGGHKFAHAVKGHFVHADVILSESVEVVAAVFRVRDERGFGRVAGEPLGSLFRVVAERHSAHEHIEISARRRPLFVHRFETAIGQIIALYGHLIES